MNLLKFAPIHGILMKLKLFLFIIPVLVSCNIESNEVNCNVLKKTDTKYSIDDKLFTGNCLTFKNGVTTESRKIKNGLHKKTIGYWDTGEIKYTGGVKRDSLNGSYREYFRSGKIAKKGKFKMGYYEGRWKFTDESGRLLRITTFKKGKIISEINKN